MNDHLFYLFSHFIIVIIYYESVIDKYNSWFVLAQKSTIIFIIEPDMYEQGEW